MILLMLCGEVQALDFTYTNNNGTITITGYTGPAGAVIIPDTINDFYVTSVGDFAFYYNSTVTSVTIGQSVTNIGVAAFFGCTRLTNAIIGNSVTSVGDAAFVASGLTSVTLPNSVAIIGQAAFQSCTNLTSVTIPSNITSIVNSAFQSCSSLTQITIPNSVTMISNNAFQSCSSLTQVTIPNSVTTIGNNAFQSCSSLTNVIIGNNVTSIPEWCFGYCFSLATLTIPSRITTIDNFAFLYCTNLPRYLTFPNTLIYIGARAFYHCNQVTEIYFMGNAPTIGGSNGFETFTNTIAYYLPGTMGWGSTLVDIPTALWTLPYPLILSGSSSFGLRTNKFGFTVSWATNVSVVVEANTNLSSHLWEPILTNTLTNGWFYFDDSQWTNYPNRFYRLRSD
jgi:hypothetical protein